MKVDTSEVDGMEESILQNIAESSAWPNSKSEDAALRLYLDECCGVIAYTGKLLLECGGEVERVEYLMQKIGRSFDHIDQVTPFAILTGIMVTVSSGSQFATKIVRIYGIQNNLSRLRQISALARDLSKHPRSPDVVADELQKIVEEPRYKPWQTVLFASIGAGGFGFFFYETLPGIAAIFVIGALVQLIGLWFDNYQINRFLKILCEAFVATFACQMAARWLPGTHFDKMLLSVLMLLVPGMTLTNSLRDTVSGNYVSGMSRLTEALLVGVSIAMGSAIALAFIR